MELTLANFRQALDTAILERGRRYYADGRVMDLDEVDTGCWQAVVQGTDNYQAEISITEDGNLEWACDCPYDCGPACKHIVAVL